MNNVKIPETNEAYNKLFYWFFSFPYKEVSLNEIVRETKISKTTANRIIKKLISEGFVKKETIGRNWRLKNNIEHKFNKTKKVSFNLEIIYSSNIIELIYKKIQNPKAIILFGSYRKGDDTEKSDIDIAVEILGNKKFEIIELLVFKEFGYRKNIKVNIHIFSRDNINQNLFSNIANGIVLDGFLEVKK